MKRNGAKSHRMSCVVKQGKNYYFRKMIDGRLICKSLKTSDYDEAVRRAKDYTILDSPGVESRVRIAAMVEFLKPDEANPTLDEAINNYCNHPRNATQSEPAQSTDIGRWRYFLWWLHGHDKERSRINRKGAHPEIERLKQITTEVATEFVRFAQGTTSAATINKYIRVYKRIWTYNNMTSNPWTEFAKLQSCSVQRRSLDESEVKLLIDSAEGELRTLFVLGPYTGLRMQDCAHMRWECIDPNISVLSVQPHKTSLSSGRTVHIPIHPILRAELASVGQRKTGYVMPTLAAMPEWRLSDTVQAHFKSCGLEEWVQEEGRRRRSAIVGFHSFRSTFISNLANAGAPLALVRDIVGHVSEEMTQRYYRGNAALAAQFVNALK